MDQRKIHMLVREIFPKMNWKVPIAVHHKLLPGLSEPTDTSKESKLLGKMSKSDPNSGIFIHDSDDNIRSKIKKAWCEEGNIENNPLLEITKHVILHDYNELSVERPEKFGGNVTYEDFSQLENDFSNRKLHPSDLKQSVASYLIKIISPIREKLTINEELFNAIKQSA